MIDRNAHTRIPARLTISAALAAVLLGACSAHTSTSSNARVPEAAALDAGLPEIVITAHRLDPEELPDGDVRASKAQAVPVPNNIAEDPEATARKSRATNASDETG